MGITGACGGAFTSLRGAGSSTACFPPGSSRGGRMSVLDFGNQPFSAHGSLLVSSCARKSGFKSEKNPGG